MTFEDYEDSVLEFAVRANTILWEDQSGDSCKRMIEEFGVEKAKEKTLGLIFRSTKLALPYKC